MKTMKEQKDGWTKRVFPRPGIYRMACCDCGLVHDMKFGVVEILDNDGEEFLYRDEPLDPKRYRTFFRARRNKRSTAAIRRKKK